MFFDGGLPGRAARESWLRAAVFRQEMAALLACLGPDAQQARALPAARITSPATPEAVAGPNVLLERAPPGTCRLRRRQTWIGPFAPACIRTATGVAKFSLPLEAPISFPLRFLPSYQAQGTQHSFCIPSPMARKRMRESAAEIREWRLMMGRNTPDLLGHVFW